MIMLLAASASAGGMRDVKEKSLTRVEKSKYVVIQLAAIGDAPPRAIGYESVVRRTYDDNTITYDARVVMQFTEEVSWDHTTSLTVEEESYFPRAYSMKRITRQGDNEFTMNTKIRMFSNVAVIEKDIGAKVEKVSMVLPTGAPFVDMGIAHQFYQLLFWYDDQSGGRQSFEYFDPTRYVVSSLVLNRGGSETIDINGKKYETTIYTVERENSNSKIFVDDKERIIRLDQNYMRFDLVEWSDEDPANG